MQPRGRRGQRLKYSQPPLCLKGNPPVDHCALLNNVSVNSKPDHPPGNTLGNFLNVRISHHPSTKRVRNPDPWGKKIVLKPHPGQILSKNPAKTTKHETEIMKNSTECRYVSEILKQRKHIKAQSFLVGGFCGYSVDPKSQCRAISSKPKTEMINYIRE